MQGEALSPLLFSLYVNDMETNFINNNCDSIELNSINMFLLLYADDTVIFSESVSGLQKMLDSLHSYTTEWDLSVNKEKTKVVIFRNGGKIRDSEAWHYDGVNLDIVDSFIYLGLLFFYNGKFKQTQLQLSNQGRKAMFALNSNVKKLILILKLVYHYLIHILLVF